MAGGVISTGTHPKALWPGVREWWGQVYNTHPTEYTDLYDVMDSDQAWEEDVQATGFGLAAVKPEGASITYDSETQGHISRYTHIAYALGYKVTYEERKDNKYEQLAMRRSEGNAFSMSQTIEVVATSVYNDAFTGAVFTHADGQPLLSASHVNVTGGVFSNLLTPGAAMSETSLEDICIQLMGFTNDRGLNIQVLPRSLHVPRQLWFSANRILGSVLQPNQTTNNINVLKATNAFPEGIKLNHYFTSAGAYFIRTNVRHGMLFFWNERPDLQQDNDFDTKNAKAAAYMRFIMGNTDPRGIIGNAGP